MVIELDDTLHRFTDNRRDSVWATHELPREVFVWKTTLGRGRTRPNSLIVIAKGGHSCCLHGSRMSCCQVIFPCKVTIDSDLRDTLGYG
jgi:hypothetical protein